MNYAFVVTRKAARVRHCCRPNTQHHIDQRDVISDHRVYMYMYMYMYMYIVFWKFVSLRKRLSKLFIGDNSRENERERESVYVIRAMEAETWRKRMDPPHDIE